MSWSSLFRASRFFAAAGVVWLTLGLIPMFRSKPVATIDVYLHAKYVVLSAPLLFVFAGSVLVIFGGVYGLFEQRHRRRANLILGQMHFWLTAVPLGILFRVLYRFAQPAGAGAGDVNLQAIVQAEMKTLVWSWLVLLLAQFIFLANLAIAFFRKAVSE